MNPGLYTQGNQPILVEDSSRLQVCIRIVDGEAMYELESVERIDHDKLTITFNAKVLPTED